MIFQLILLEYSYDWLSTCYVFWVLSILLWYHAHLLTPYDPTGAPTGASKLSIMLLNDNTSDVESSL